MQQLLLLYETCTPISDRTQVIQMAKNTGFVSTMICSQDNQLGTYKSRRKILIFLWFVKRVLKLDLQLSVM